MSDARLKIKNVLLLVITIIFIIALIVFKYRTQNSADLQNSDALSEYTSLTNQQPIDNTSPQNSGDEQD